MDGHLGDLPDIEKAQGCRPVGAAGAAAPDAEEQRATDDTEPLSDLRCVLGWVVGRDEPEESVAPTGGRNTKNGLHLIQYPFIVYE